MNCQLRWICPKLRHWFYLRENENLTHLPFLPDTTYDPAKANFNHEYAIEYDPENLNENLSMIATFDGKFLSKEPIPMKSRKPIFDFKECEIESAACNCCANFQCENMDASNKKFVEQVVVMDFSFQSSTYIEEDDDMSRKYSLLPGKWKSKIQTVLCEDCIPEVKNRLENIENQDIPGPSRVHQHPIQNSQTIHQQYSSQGPQLPNQSFAPQDRQPAHQQLTSQDFQFTNQFVVQDSQFMHQPHTSQGPQLIYQPIPPQDPGSVNQQFRYDFPTVYEPPHYDFQQNPQYTSYQPPHQPLENYNEQLGDSHQFVYNIHPGYPIDQSINSESLWDSDFYNL
ncbi:hypothetical protein FO519_000062 [Halicephalobus sp. NKZ332]|nr:hypothetical protein FO519_000062 [Halicephalobus sp. NKZ332]